MWDERTFWNQDPAEGKNSDRARVVALTKCQASPVVIVGGQRGLQSSEHSPGLDVQECSLLGLAVAGGRQLGCLHVAPPCGFDFFIACLSEALPRYKGKESALISQC